MTSAPPHAITVWNDSVNIYAELPGSPPNVLKFSLTEGGLTKVLALMKQRLEQGYPRSGSYQFLEPKSNKPALKGTQAQRDLAAQVLKKLGMI